MTSKHKLEYTPHLRRPPPQAFRHSKHEGVSRLRRHKSAPSTKAAELSSESKALREEAEREKMLDDYYNSVRQSAVQVKNRLSELEMSLGASESDSILAGVQAPNFESLGISFTAKDILQGSKQLNDDDYEYAVSDNGSENADEDDTRHMTNADVIVRQQ